MALVWMGESLDCNKQDLPCWNLSFPDTTMVLLHFSTPLLERELGEPSAPPQPSCCV